MQKKREQELQQHRGDGADPGSLMDNMFGGIFAGLQQPAQKPTTEGGKALRDEEVIDPITNRRRIMAQPARARAVPVDRKDIERMIREELTSWKSIMKAEQHNGNKSYIDSRLQDIDGRVQDIDGRMQDVDNRMQGFGSRMQDVDSHVQDVETRMRLEEERRNTNAELMRTQQVLESERALALDKEEIFKRLQFRD